MACLRPYVLLSFLAIVLVAPTAAQPDEMRWGRISDDDLALATYAPDPSAAAVVLSEEGRVRLRRNLAVVFEHHRRVKVFAPAGYDLATVQITYRPSVQKLRGVEGQTFVRGADGKARKVELDRGSVFEEDVDGELRRVRFTLPALEPGAVFEYRYTLESGSPFYFPDWTFQSTVPTRWSAFRAEIPRYLEYVRFVQGSPSFAVEELQDEPLDLDAWRRDASFAVTPHSNSGVRAGSGPANRYETHVNVLQWATEDVPALPEEPHVTTLDDYLQRIEFQFAAYYDGYGIRHHVLRSWDELAQELRDHADFGRRLRPSGDARRQVGALALDTLGTVARAAAVYDFVRKGIVWDGTYRVFADHDLDRVLAQKRGSSAGVNLLLLTLLRAADVDAFPVLVSTRSHGQVLLAYPKFSQFNHVLVLVVADGQAFILDATDPLRPPGMLPVDALSGSGWLVTDDVQQWIAVTPTTLTGTSVFVDGTLADDGTLSGKLSARLAGYDALAARRKLEENGSTAAETLEDAPPALETSDVEVNGADGDGAVTVRSAFRDAGRGQAIAHLLTFSPVLLSGLTENPFRRPERTYPVDLAYSYATTYNAEIALPEGYVVDELPAPVTSSLLEGAAEYRCTMEVKDGKLRVQRQLTVQRVRFEPEEYPVLRTFFDEVVAGDAALVVLVREAGAESGSP